MPSDNLLALLTERIKEVASQLRQARRNHASPPFLLNLEEELLELSALEEFRKSQLKRRRRDYAQVDFFDMTNVFQTAIFAVQKQRDERRDLGIPTPRRPEESRGTGPPRGSPRECRGRGRPGVARGRGRGTQGPALLTPYETMIDPRHRTETPTTDAYNEEIRRRSEEYSREIAERPLRLRHERELRELHTRLENASLAESHPDALESSRQAEVNELALPSYRAAVRTPPPPPYDWRDSVRSPLNRIAQPDPDRPVPEPVQSDMIEETRSANSATRPHPGRPFPPPVRAQRDIEDFGPIPSGCCR